MRCVLFHEQALAEPINAPYPVAAEADHELPQD
jgi:hypothetical protein